MNFSGQDLTEFLKIVQTDDDAKAYLCLKKYGARNQFFDCPGCGHKECWTTPSRMYARTCKKCRKIDTCTANTMFHRCRFGLRKAFLIVFDQATSRKSLSANYISDKYDIAYNTAWFFMNKTRKAMASQQPQRVQDNPLSAERNRLKGVVYVDEYVIGGAENTRGRVRDTKKKKVVIAVECTPTGGIKRVYNQVIQDYSTASIRPIFDTYISKTAKVLTDEFNSYKPLMRRKTSPDGWNIVQSKEIRFQNNSPGNRMIQQLKSWVRGVHHHCSKKHCQGYLDEFSFKKNRSNMKNEVFNLVLNRMVQTNRTVDKYTRKIAFSKDLFYNF